MSWTGDPVTAGFTAGRPFRPLAPNSTTHHVALQAGAPGSLHAHYRRLLALRQSHRSLARGSVEQVAVEGGVLWFERAWGDDRTRVIVNTGAACHIAGRALPAHSVQVVELSRT